MNRVARTMVYGDINLDIVVKAAGPERYASDTPGEIKLEGGGSPANFAAWAAYLGMKVCFYGKVGADSVAEYLLDDLQKWGVEVSLITEPSRPTGKILLFIDHQGERTMITDRGANLTFSPADLPEGIFKGYNHLHLTGYNLFDSNILLKTALKALKCARKNQMTISVDPSSYALIERFGVKEFLNLTADAELAFPNLDEGRMLTGKKEPDKIVKRLLEYYHLVVLKLGADGCLVGRKNGSGQTQLTGFPVGKIVENPDTTGAGDAFAAGFVAGYLQDRREDMEGFLSNCVIKANEAAINCIKKGGGRPPLNK